jgi:hypothetical protein
MSVRPNDRRPVLDTATLRVIGHETATAQLDLGPPGPGLGDEVVFSGELLRPGGHREIGHFEGTLTAVTPDAGSRN